MSLRPTLALALALASGGCLYNAREHIDRSVSDLAARPFDPEPPARPPASLPAPDKPATKPAPGAARETSAPPTDVQTVSLLQGAEGPKAPPDKLRLEVPGVIPGTEAPSIIKLPEGQAERLAAIRRIYPELPPLPEQPTALSGPGGRPYTLADLQQIAAANSPALKQAAADVETARGNLLQAKTYPNPNFGLEVDPSNNGETAGVWGLFLDQPIRTGGKMKLQTAAAQKDLDNAELALRRARSDLATSVRSAYFGLLVARETVRVTRGLAVLTDEIYRLQVGLLEKAGVAAGYEPAQLRAQAYSARLALKQAISSYLYAWKQLVAAVGVRQLPLSEVAGRVDAAIPYYDYDAVLAHVLTHHTDVLTALNGITKNRETLKLAQVTPAFPDLDFRLAVLKEFALPPFTMMHTVQLSMPLPVWDRNKGNIIAAEATLARAMEEPHRVEQMLTNNVAQAYLAYKNNLDALEYYRRNILPDQVRAYRGVLARRQIDPGAAFGDLVTAQQTLATNVTTYLTLLGQLWTSVVNVADFLQTDDLFQVGRPGTLPELPDLAALPPLPCCHAAPGHPATLPRPGDPAPAEPGAPTAPRSPGQPAAPAPVRNRESTPGAGGPGG